jgi:hypothetical protein
VGSLPQVVEGFGEVVKDAGTNFRSDRAGELHVRRIGVQHVNRRHAHGTQPLHVTVRQLDAPGQKHLARRAKDGIAQFHSYFELLEVDQAHGVVASRCRSLRQKLR